jgi:hypothetical protein
MPAKLWRCEAVPLPDDQISLRIDGEERIRWHAGPRYPRPFFYPFVGPSGESLTRIGHPGAPNHDHHRSLWFAHEKVLGINFWTENTPARIEQRGWLALHESDSEAALAVTLNWRDGHDPRPLVEQEVVAAIRPTGEGETLFELHCTFRPTSEALEFQETNFGFLGIRVARSISAWFGEGQLTSSEGSKGEPAIFGKPARWMDYSGPIASGTGSERTSATEGITCFDHPTNPGHPVSWHVREDGWMGPSACRNGSLITTMAKPLVLRYLLWAHGGAVDPDRANSVWDAFAASPGYRVKASDKKHQQYEIVPSA